MPTLEYGGPDLMTVELKMCFISPWTTAPSEAMAIIDTYMSLSVPQFLIVGSSPVGRGTSRFVIDQVTERWKIVEAGGQITSSEVRLRLLEYPDFLSNNFAFNTAVSAVSAIGAAF
jgi:hypothetical protein